MEQVVLSEENKRICEEMWKRYEPKVRRICNEKLKSIPFEIDDTVAEVYLGLCNAYSNNKNIKNPLNYLYKITYNLIYKKYQHINKEKNLTIKYIAGNPDILTETYEIDFDDKKLNDVEIEKLVQEILSELDDTELMLFKYLDLEKRRMKEVAEMMGTTIPAVKQRHYRLVKHIKELAHEKIENY